MNEGMDEMIDMDKAQNEMGNWLAKYFMDAGYFNWHQFPSMYKVMIMNAFPPVDSLDGKAIDWKTADLEHLYLGFLKVADSHIKARQSQLGILAALPFGLSFLRVSK